MEEFSSNESGWTKYLGSPSQQEFYSSGVEDGDYNYYNGRDRGSRNRGVKSKENEDDDSITSDASSGPRSRGVFIARKINEDDDEDEEYFPAKRLEKGKSVKVSTMATKAKGALKQKRGKKAT